MKSTRILTVAAALFPEGIAVSEAAEAVGEVIFCGKEAAELPGAYAAFDLSLPREAWLESGTRELNERLNLEAAKLKLKEAEGWIEDVNRRFRPDEWDSPNMYNCGSSAIAVEKRLSGVDPEAKAVLGQTNLHEDMEAALGRNVMKVDKGAIEAELRKRGPGSHLVVGVKCKWKPDYWFNAFFDGEDVYTIDAHKGEWSYIRKDLPEYRNVEHWLMMA